MRATAEGTDGRGGRAAVQALRRVVAALVAVEVVLLLGLGVLMFVDLVAAEATNTGAAVALGAIFLTLGAGLGVAARGVLQGHRWARAPVLTWQVMQAGVGASVTASDRWYVGAPALLVAVVAGALVLRRDVVDR